MWGQQGYFSRVLTLQEGLNFQGQFYIGVRQGPDFKSHDFHPKN